MLISRLKGKVRSLAEKLYYNRNLESLERLLKRPPNKNACDKLGIHSGDWRDAVFVAITEKKASSLCHGRKLLRLTQSELADELGLSSQQISNFESGRANITRQTETSMECLLRRADKWDGHCKNMSINPKARDKRVDYDF